VGWTRSTKSPDSRSSNPMHQRTARVAVAGAKHIAGHLPEVEVDLGRGVGPGSWIRFTAFATASAGPTLHRWLTASSKDRVSPLRRRASRPSASDVGSSGDAVRRLCWASSEDTALHAPCSPVTSALRAAAKRSHDSGSPAPQRCDRSCAQERKDRG